VADPDIMKAQRGGGVMSGVQAYRRVKDMPLRLKFRKLYCLIN